MNMVDTIYQFTALIIFLFPTILIIIGLIFLFRIMKRAEKRAEERLKIEKENSTYQQEQTFALQNLNKQLADIEKILTDVN